MSRLEPGKKVIDGRRGVESGLLIGNHHWLRSTILGRFNSGTKTPYPASYLAA